MLGWLRVGAGQLKIKTVRSRESSWTYTTCQPISLFTMIIAIDCSCSTCHRNLRHCCKFLCTWLEQMSCSELAYLRARDASAYDVTPGSMGTPLTRACPRLDLNLRSSMMNNRSYPSDCIRNNFDEDPYLLECSDTDSEDDESDSDEGTRLMDE